MLPLDAFRSPTHHYQNQQEKKETRTLPALAAAANMQMDHDHNNDHDVVDVSVDTIRGFPFTGPVGSVGARDSVTGTYSIDTTSVAVSSRRMGGSGGGADDETEACRFG